MPILRWHRALHRHAECFRSLTLLQERSYTTLRDGSEDGEVTRSSTPWVRHVISGVDLMRNNKYNKGLAFSHQERDRLYLRGLLPPAVLSQEIQADRVMLNIRGMRSSVNKVTYLLSLQERNERLFYQVLTNNIEEILPLLQYPIVGEYCQEYSLMFRSLPRGLYLSLEDKGHVSTIIKNWPERRVKTICLTDGEVVGTKGDLGVQAIAAPISRLALFTALGGVDPSTCLPVTIDNGTDNQALLDDPIYVGARHRRVKGDAYFELVDEFLKAVRIRFGASVLIDIEDSSWKTTQKLIATYRSTFPMYSDGHYGYPTLALAAIFASHVATGLAMSEHRFVLVGESPALSTIAELLEEAVQSDSRRVSLLEARASIFLVDSNGLVVRNRADAEHIADHKLPYIQDGPECPDLLSTIKHVKPTILIGLSDGPPPHAFSKEVLEEMAAHTARPIVMPMSLHSPDGQTNAGEVSPEHAYEWTKGQCLFADVHNTREVAVPNGAAPAYVTALNPAHVFPGVGLGTFMSRSTRLREEMFVEVAKTLARLVGDEPAKNGALLPPMSAARDVAAHVAATLAHKAYAAGVATELPKPYDLLGGAYNWMYDPMYKKYR